jgi:dTDP-4-dehydrorhamnose reductase
VVILVTGADGMVGTYFAKLRTEFDEALELTDIDSLDVTDWSAVRDRIAAPGRYSTVVHLAAETDVDGCEREPDRAFLTNAVGTHNVALACQSAGTVMVYTSTAGVFGGDGASGPFTEYDTPHPANTYGLSKLAGETHVTQLLNRFFIIRPGWMMGGNAKDKKFVAKILMQVREGGGEIRAVIDKSGSPTYARELVLGIRDLLRSSRFGLYHMTNHGVCSRYDVATRIVRFLRADVRVVPVNSAHFPLAAPRANSEAMRNLNLELIGLDRMSRWEDALDAYLEECTGQSRPRA